MLDAVAAAAAASATFASASAVVVVAAVVIAAAVLSVKLSVNGGLCYLRAIERASRAIDRGRYCLPLR